LGFARRCGPAAGRITTINQEEEHVAEVVNGERRQVRRSRVKLPPISHQEARVRAAHGHGRLVARPAEYLILAHAIECGLLHTGLPSCCVAFFVSEFFAMSTKDRAAYGELAREDSKGNRHDYVRCPKCVEEGLFVNPKPCACDANMDLVLSAQKVRIMTEAPAMAEKTS
jgi:hypothetical protein